MMKPKVFEEGVSHRQGIDLDLEWVQDLQLRTHQGRTMPIASIKSYTEGFPRQMLISEKEKEGPIGYLLYVILGTNVKIIDMAVEPYYQRRGIGTMMLLPLMAKGEGCSSIIRDTCLEGQLLFRSVGFQCIQILKGYFRSPMEDGYYFLKEKAPPLPPTKDKGPTTKGRKRPKK